LKQELTSQFPVLFVQQSILSAVDNGDVSQFTGSVVEFDQLTKLDNWKTKILLEIKNSIGEESNLM